MFRKVLIAEDHEVANISLQKTLADLGINKLKYVYYCDDALTWINSALKSNDPYDLLITDLSFEEDYHQQKIASGVELIKAVRQVQPSLKILVFSAENRIAVIDKLFKDEELAINAYVRKARHDARELRLAMVALAKNKKHLTADLRINIKEKHSHEFTPLDIAIIDLLSKGILLKEIPSYLQRDNFKPAGLSSVEKRLNIIKKVLGFSKNEQLVAHCKDMGII